MRWAGIWAFRVRPGGTDWGSRPNGYDGYQYHRPGVSSKQYRIRRGVVEVNHECGRRHTGGIRHGFPGLTLGLEHHVNTLSRAKRGDMRFLHQQTYPAHRSIPPLLHPGEPTRLGRGPGTLPRPKYHSVRGLQRNHTILEPPQSTGCWSADGVRVGEYPKPSWQHWQFQYRKHDLRCRTVDFWGKEGKTSVR